MQACYSIDYLFTVHEHVFDPPLKGQIGCYSPYPQWCFENRLQRAVIQNGGENSLQSTSKADAQFAQTFGGKRKSGMFADRCFDKRPEQLDVAAFIDLTNRIEKTAKPENGISALLLWKNRDFKLTLNL